MILIFFNWYHFSSIEQEAISFDSKSLSLKGSYILKMVTGHRKMGNRVGDKDR